MSRTRKVLLVVISVVVLFGGYGIYRAIIDLSTSNIIEAYEAWDTGTLVVEYIKTNDGALPTSWEDLIELVVVDADKRIILRGAGAGDVVYATGLQDVVKIEWPTDPTADVFPPITRADGTSFQTLWESADPNEMIREQILMSAEPIQEESIEP